MNKLNFLSCVCIKLSSVSLNQPFINLTLLLTCGNLPFILNVPLSKLSLHFPGKPSKLYHL